MGSGNEWEGVSSGEGKYMEGAEMKEKGHEKEKEDSEEDGKKMGEKRAK